MQTSKKDAYYVKIFSAIYFDSVCFTVRIEADAAEPCVFRVTPEFGIMKFKNPQSTSWNQTLWISFTPR